MLAPIPAFVLVYTPLDLEAIATNTGARLFFGTFYGPESGATHTVYRDGQEVGRIPASDLQVLTRDGVPAYFWDDQECVVGRAEYHMTTTDAVGNVSQPSSTAAVEQAECLILAIPILPTPGSPPPAPIISPDSGITIPYPERVFYVVICNVEPSATYTLLRDGEELLDPFVPADWDNPDVSVGPVRSRFESRARRRRRGPKLLSRPAPGCRLDHLVPGSNADLWRSSGDL